MYFNYFLSSDIFYFFLTFKCENYVMSLVINTKKCKLKLNYCVNETQKHLGNFWTRLYSAFIDKIHKYIVYPVILEK